MNCDELISIAHETAKELDTIWTIIGSTADERNAHIQKLIMDVKAVYAGKVATEANVRDTMITKIAKMKQEILKVYEMLAFPDSHASFQCFHAYNNTFSGTLVECDKYFSTELDKCNELKQAQEESLQQKFTKVTALWTQLGSAATEEFTEIGQDITCARIGRLDKEITVAEEEIEDRKAAVIEVCKHLKEQMEELCLVEERHEETAAPLSDLDHLILKQAYDTIGVHADRIKDLEERTEQLTKVRSERDVKLREMAQKITALWHRLEVSTDTQQKWISEHKGLSIASLRACEVEYARLLQLKADSLNTLISAADEKILKLWDEMQVSQQEREDFRKSLPNACSDEAFEMHEDKLVELEKKATAMRPLLKLVQKRQELQVEKMDFERSQQDPNRFKIAGRMIQEEKMRKALAKSIPKVDGQLRQSIPEWEAMYGPFVVDGVRYLEKMDSEENQDAQEKEQIKADKEREKLAKRVAAANERGGTVGPLDIKAAQNKEKKSPMKENRPATAKGEKQGSALNFDAADKKGGIKPQGGNSVSNKGGAKALKAVSNKGNENI